MKYQGCFCAILMSTVICSAQKIKQHEFFLSNGLVDIQTGLSIPVSDFALSELTLPAGYAKPGYNIKLGINYDVTSYLGLALQYQYTQNPYNSSKLLSDLRNSTNDYTFNSYTSNPWILQGMMLGIYYPLRTHKTTIDIRLLGSLLTGVLPENDEDITIPSLNNQHYHFKQFENSASGLGVQAGIKIRHQLYKKLTLSLSADYTYANIKFQEIKVIETVTSSRVPVDDYSQKFQMINLSAGIGIQFD